jgi:uncharacterized protein YbaR (Trm112 family)
MLRCPVCKKKLWLNPTMRVGTLVGCVNCDTSLRVTNRNPDRLEPIKQTETLTADSKPESYA